MARIRSVHPEQWTDEEFVELSPTARLLALAIRNIADDFGIFPWKPKQIKMRLLPADDESITELLDQLIQRRTIIRFTHDDEDFGAIRNFCQYQKPNKLYGAFPLPKQLFEYVRASEDLIKKAKTSNVVELSGQMDLFSAKPAKDSLPTETKNTHRVVPTEAQLPNHDGSTTEPLPNQYLQGEERRGVESGGYPPHFVGPPLDQKPNRSRSNEGSAIDKQFTEQGANGWEWLPDDWREYAHSKIPSITPQEVNDMAEEFYCYWAANSNRDMGRKKDWKRTWQSNVMNMKGKRYGKTSGRPTGPHKTTVTQAAADALAAVDRGEI